MTYLNFLLLMVVLPALILLALVRPKKQEWLFIAALVAMAYVWTTPWDNYLVASGVWSYHPKLVLGIILGWVPVEEYLFFGCMTILSGTWVVGLLRDPIRGSPWVRWLACLALAAALLELLLLQREIPLPGARSLNYLGLILTWSLPVILLQLGLGRKTLWKTGSVWLLGTLAPTLYLTAADALPLGAGTWKIDPQQSINWFLPGHVPLEEAAFFFFTNLMIVQGLILALDPQVQARISGLWTHLRTWNIWRIFIRKLD
jgi:lycopene beta-cyclase